MKCKLAIFLGNFFNLQFNDKSFQKKTKKLLEVWGIEPQTSRMQSERSTPELYPRASERGF